MPQITYVPLSQLQFSGPTYRPLVRSLTRYYKGEEQPEQREIAVADLQIEPSFRSPEEHVAIMVRDFKAAALMRQEMMSRIPVMQRSDGSLWVYDDCATVEAAKRVAPNSTMHCDVFRDRSR